MNNNSRRSFIKKTAIASTLFGVIPSFTKLNFALGIPPGDRLNIGVIGVGMGMADMRNMLANKWVHCIALCDVNQARLEQQAANVKRNFPENAGNIKLYNDFRKLLENKDIDGVIIATPDHWHTYIFAMACMAGKAIYVEKPVGNSIAECNIMVDIQKKYNNIVTTGLWQTSQRYFKGANEILKSGILGDVFKVHIYLCSSTNPRIPAEGNNEVPPTLDYDMWLGPAPQRPYSYERVRNWRSYWDYGGGQQTDWGVHWIDSAFDGLAALGKERSYPKSVYSTAYKHPKSSNETPSCQTSIFKYDDYHIVWEQQVTNLYNRKRGVSWIGSNGTLVCNRSGYELIPGKSRDGSLLCEATRLDGKFEDGGVLNHTTNWGECIRNNDRNTNSPIIKGAFATILAHMANISFRSDSIVRYDRLSRRFIDNKKADAFLKPIYRDPWEWPVI